MQPLSIPCIAMASINFYVGIYYFFFFLKWPKIHEHLPFAFFCLSIGLYDVFSAGLYNSITIQEGISWQRLQLYTIGIISIFLIWFTSVFTEQKVNRIILFLIAWFVMIGLVQLVASPELTLSPSRPLIKNIHLLNRYTITYYEGNLGIIYQVEILSMLIAFFYICYLLIRYYQKTHNRTPLLILACLGFYFIGIVNDSFVANQVYAFVYISEYLFSFLILVMAYTLLDRFVNLYTAFEELNINLERKVEERTHQIRELNEDLKRIADRDGLTGIYNRRFFNEYFEIEMKRARSFLEHKHQLGADQRNEMNFGLALIDIDHFKQINDQYGHLAGDLVLKQVSEIMEHNIFSRDVLCRYGGDEFALLLTKTSPEGIFLAMEKIRREIGEYHFSGESKLRGLKVTISTGLVNFNEVKDWKSEEILKLADDRLLKAKSLGRNQIIYRDNNG
jgi:diguanylate cyclase (GGDEF)-like protein